MIVKKSLVLLIYDNKFNVTDRQGKFIKSRLKYCPTISSMNIRLMDKRYIYIYI